MDKAFGLSLSESFQKELSPADTGPHSQQQSFILFNKISFTFILFKTLILTNRNKNTIRRFNRHRRENRDASIIAKFDNPFSLTMAALHGTEKRGNSGEPVRFSSPDYTQILE